MVEYDYKMYDLTKSLGLTKKENPYKTECGNGEKIPTHFFDKKNGLTVKNLDENKKMIFDNLYEKIQLQTPSTNYKRLINKNSSLDDLKMIFDTKEQKEKDNYMDTTEIGDLETLKKTENQIINKFGSIEAYEQFQNQKLNNFQMQITKHKQFMKKYLQRKEQEKQKKIDEFNEWKNNKK